MLFTNKNGVAAVLQIIMYIKTNSKIIGTKMFSGCKNQFLNIFIFCTLWSPKFWVGGLKIVELVYTICDT